MTPRQSFMLNIARRCVPFTPFDKDLSTATVALVSATVFAPLEMFTHDTPPGKVVTKVIR